MKIHDISLAIHPGLTVWPNSPQVVIKRILDQGNGAVATVSEITLGTHTGTHVDAPLHFVPGGAGIERLALDMLCGPAWVCHVPHVHALSAEVLSRSAIPIDTTRLLCRTRNSEFWATGSNEFWTDYVGVTADGAQWLVDQGIRVIGIDYLSVAPYADPITPHEILLRAGVIPLEGLNLAGIAPGPYQLFSLPLKLVGTEGAPARTILVEHL